MAIEGDKTEHITPRKLFVLKTLLSELGIDSKSPDWEAFSLMTIKLLEDTTYSDSVFGALRNAWFARSIGEDGFKDSTVIIQRPVEVSWVMGKDLGAHENLQFPDNPIELATITFVNPNRPIGDNLIFEEFQSPSYHPDKPETYWHRLIHHPNIIIGGDTLPFERETYITNEPQTPMEVKNVIRIVLLGTQGADKQQYQDTFFERRDRHPNPQLN